MSTFTYLWRALSQYTIAELGIYISNPFFCCWWNAYWRVLRKRSSYVLRNELFYSYTKKSRLIQSRCQRLPVYVALCLISQCIIPLEHIMKSTAWWNVHDISSNWQDMVLGPLTLPQGLLGQLGRYVWRHQAIVIYIHRFYSLVLGTRIQQITMSSDWTLFFLLFFFFLLLLLLVFVVVGDGDSGVD